jgi:hypothetical protein
LLSRASVSSGVETVIAAVPSYGYFPFLNSKLHRSRSVLTARKQVSGMVSVCL